MSSPSPPINSGLRERGALVKNTNIAQTIACDHTHNNESSLLLANLLFFFFSTNNFYFISSFSIRLSRLVYSSTRHCPILTRTTSKLSFTCSGTQIKHSNHINVHETSGVNDENSTACQVRRNTQNMRTNVLSTFSLVAKQNKKNTQLKKNLRALMISNDFQRVHSRGGILIQERIGNRNRNSYRSYINMH